MNYIYIDNVIECLEDLANYDLQKVAWFDNDQGLWYSFDENVDDLFNKVKAELIAMIHEDVNAGEQASDLLMAAKYFERIGDHATNISEWVIFSITGQHPDDK